jgi:hypothetical protein
MSKPAPDYPGILDAARRVAHDERTNFDHQAFGCYPDPETGHPGLHTDTVEGRNWCRAMGPAYWWRAAKGQCYAG